MIRGIYTAASGMLADQKRLDVIANNLANASTTGFKRDSSVTQSFDDLLVMRAGDRNSVGDAHNNLVGRLGFGTLISNTAARLTTGSMQATGNPLDVAISGDGFFVVSTNRGLRFTRNGSFRQAPDGSLVTQEGYQVMVDGNPLTATPGSVSISGDGQVRSGNQMLGHLSIVSSAEAGSIKKEGNGLWAPVDPGEPTELITTADPSGHFDLRIGYLEASNVEPVTEMVEMMTTMRSYEANQKSIQAQDEALQKAVSEVGRIG